MSADMSKYDDIIAFTGAAIEKFGKIDILINNAGVSFKKPSVEVTERDWDVTYNTDFKGYFFMAQQAAKDMIAKGSIKLRIMSELTERNSDKVASLHWKETAYKVHEQEMIGYLKGKCAVK
jgi:NAD(P)-dependent dehydrogenase (short-subunit alcohol dehydrogenase family)